MRFVNLTGKDLTLRFTVADGVSEEKEILAATCHMQVAEGQVVGNCDEIPLWMVDGYRLRLNYTNGNECEAFDGSYQWSTGVMYIVTHECLMALQGMSGDLHFASPVGAVANRPNTYTGLQVVQPTGRLRKSLTRWPS